MESKHQSEFESNAPSIYKELPPIDSSKIEKWLRKKVFNTGYIFYDKKKDDAICSVCGESFSVPEIAKNKVVGLCPHCKTSVEYKPSGYGREKLTEKIRLLLIQSKGKDLYITLNMVYLDFTDGYGKLYKDCEAVYKFNRTTQEGWHTSYSYYYGGGWYEMTTMYIPQRQGDWRYAQLVLYDENINTVFKKTDLKYCMLEKQSKEWNLKDYIKVIDLNAKYESIEKLYKVGLTEIIKGKIFRSPGGRVIKWRKSQLKDILQLTKPEISKVKDLKYDMSEISIYKSLIKAGLKINLEDVQNYHYYDVEEVKTIETDSFKNIWRYLEKQLKNEKSKNGYCYYSIQGLAKNYKDYIKECKELELNLNDNMIRYPRDLNETHARTSAQIKIIANKEKDKQIYNIALNNKNLNYENKSYLIRVAESATEIIEEGKNLSHCVGGYIDSVIRGNTLILFVRKTEEPNTSYYTLELTSKKINQCRGKSNCSMTDEVKAFVDKWHKENVMNSNKKTEQKKTVKKEKTKVA